MYRQKRDAPLPTTESSDDFLDFRRPTTPDPDVNVEEQDSKATILSLEEIRKVLWEEEGVNATGDYVRGRNSCSECPINIFIVVITFK